MLKKELEESSRIGVQLTLYVVLQRGGFKRTTSVSARSHPHTITLSHSKLPEVIELLYQEAEKDIEKFVKGALLAVVRVRSVNLYTV